MAHPRPTVHRPTVVVVPLQAMVHHHPVTTVHHHRVTTVHHHRVTTVLHHRVTTVLHHQVVMALHLVEGHQAATEHLRTVVADHLPATVHHRAAVEDHPALTALLEAAVASAVASAAGPVESRQAMAHHHADHRYQQATRHPFLEVVVSPAVTARQPEAAVVDTRDHHRLTVHLAPVVAVSEGKTFFFYNIFFFFCYLDKTVNSLERARHILHVTIYCGSRISFVLKNTLN